MLSLSWFDNWSLRRKLLSSFTAVALLSVLVGGIGIRNMARLAELTDTMYQKEAMGISFVKEANVNLVYVGRALRQALLSETDEEFAKAEQRLREADGRVLAMLDSADVRFYTPEGRKIVVRSKDEYRAYANSALAVLAQARAEGLAARRASVERLRSEVGPLGDVIDSTLSVLARAKESNASAAQASAASIYRSSRLFLMMVIAGALGMGLALGWLIADRLSSGMRVIVDGAEALRLGAMRPLQDMADAIGSGDVERTVKVSAPSLAMTRTDEIGQLGRAFDAIAHDAQEAAQRMDAGRRSLAGMVNESASLATAAAGGNLTPRAKASAFEGSYRELLEGINRLLDNVATPLDDVSRTLTLVANRDLAARVRGQYAGAFDQLAVSVNQAAINLDTALRQVQTASAQVASAGSQISSGSQALASGSSEQAASLEEISSSMTEFSSLTSHTLHQTQEGAQLAQQTAAASSKGSNEVRGLEATMTRIFESSTQTSRIIKTIDEIAFQTNLLALNAAVEAARAGDAGRGFAVVAEEVRALALRAAEAARSTTSLIEQSMLEVQAGVVASSAVAETLQHIDRAVGSTAKVMVEIADGSRRQKDGVQQIAAAIEQLNGVTQQMAANAEESAAAAEELAGQSNELESLVGQFSLSDERAHAPSMARASRSHRARPASGKRAVLTAVPDDAMEAIF